MANSISVFLWIGSDSLTKFLFEIWKNLNVQMLYPLIKYKKMKAHPHKNRKLAGKVSNIIIYEYKEHVLQKISHTEH